MKTSTPQSAFWLALVFFISTISVQAATFTSVTDGNWTDPATWGEATLTPGSGDDVIIANDVTIGGSTTADFATITISSGGKLITTGGCTLSGTGGITVQTGGALDLINVVTLESNISNSGTITWQNVGFATALPTSVSGITITNEVGGIMNISGRTGTSNVDIVNNGTVTVNGFDSSGNRGFIDDDVQNNSGATWNVTGFCQINGAMTNDGSISVADGGTMSNPGTLTQNGTLTTSGTGSFSITGNLEGTGTFSGANIAANVSGVITPGSLPGCMSFANGFSTAGELNIDIGGTTACTDYDQIQGGGTVDITNSKLNVSLINSYAPTNDISFVIIDVGAITGEFSVGNITLPDANWEVEYNTPNNGEVSVTYTVPCNLAPTITSVQTGNWNDPNTWSDGVIPDECNDVVIDANHTVTLSSYTADYKSVTVNATGTLVLNNGTVLNGPGDITNNGIITKTGTVTLEGSITNNGSFTWENGLLLTSSTATLTNNASLVVNSNGVNHVSVQWDFVNSSTGTMTFNGASQGLSSNLTNEAGGTVTISSGSTVSLFGELSNAGTFNGSGTLQLNGANVTFLGGGGTFGGGGTSQLQFSNAVSVTGDATLSFGTVTIFGGAALTGTTSTLTFPVNTTTNVNGTSTITGFTDWINEGAMTKTGTVTLEGSITNNGTFTWENGFLLTSSTATLTNNSSLIVNSSGVIHPSVQWDFVNSSTGTMTFNGAVQGLNSNLTNEAGGTVTISSGSTVTLFQDISNAGTFNGGGALQLNGANVTFLGGTLGAGGSSQLAFSNAVSVTGDGTLNFGTTVINGAATVTGTNSTLTNAAFRTLNINGTSTITGFTDIINNGTIDKTGTVFLDGSITNNGTFNWINGFLNTNTTGTLTNNGTVNVSSTNAGSANWNIVNNNGANFNKTTTGNQIIQGDFTNNGTISTIAGSSFQLAGATANESLVSGAGAISNSGTFTNGSSGSVNNPFTNNGGATLQGEGTFSGLVTNQTTAILSPGTSPGCITINDDLVLNNNGAVNIEIGGTTPCTEFDQIDVNGDVALNGGTINMTIINGFVPTNDLSLLVIDGNSMTGNQDFFTENLPDANWGIAYNTPSNGDVSVTYTIPCEQAPTITSVQTGNWNDPNTWSDGVVPDECNDVVIANGTEVRLPGNQNIDANFKSLTINDGGILDVDLTGTLVGPGSISVLTGGTLELDGNVALETNISNAGTIAWSGTFGTLSSTGTPTITNESGGVINATGNGNATSGVAFVNAGTFNSSVGTTQLAINDAFTNQSTGTLNVNTAGFKFSNTFTNEGQVIVASGGTVTIANGATLNTNTGGSWTGDGTLFFEGAATIGGTADLVLGTQQVTLQNNAVLTGSGVFELSAASTLELRANTQLDGFSAITLAGTTNQLGSVTFEADVNQSGTYNWGANGALISSTSGITFTNLTGGTVNVNGLSTNTSNVAFINQGEIVRTGGSPSAAFDDGFLNDVSGTISVAGNLSFTGTATNLGTITATSGRIDVGGTSTFTQNGTVTTNGVLFLNSGTTLGTGSFGGTNIANNVGGIWSPGLSPGCMTFTQDFNFGGTLEMELEGNTPCTGYDQLQISGTANISGTLDLVYLNSYTLEPGNNYILIDANAISGTFANTSTINANLPADWSLEYNQPATGQVSLVFANPCDISFAGPTVTDESCPGAADGSITINATCNDCTGSIEYAFNGGAFGPTNQFNNLAPGDYTVQIRDGGNTICSESTTLTVNAAVDNQGPTFTCPTNRDVDLDGSCMITIPDLVGEVADLADNCDNAPTLVQSPLAATVSAILTHNQTVSVTLTATDANSQTSNCTVTLTAKDVTPPVVSNCPAAVNAALDANGEALISIGDLLGSATATDACGSVLSITNTTETILYTCSNIGETLTGGITFSDDAGNLAYCNTTITITAGSAPDFDGDGVPDCTDLDDDNDGILDTEECSLGNQQLVAEGAGSFELPQGVNKAAFADPASSDYTFSAGLFPGQYAIVNSIGGPTLLGSGVHWPSSLKGHTTGTDEDGYLAVNSSLTPNTVIYRETVTLQANTAYSYGAWFSAGQSAIGNGGHGDIGIRILDGAQTEIASFSTGDLNFFGWQRFSNNFTTGAGTSYTIEFYNLTDFNSGADIAMDDAFVLLGNNIDCDPDNDNIDNQFDLDSDGDGCLDVAEAGFSDPNEDGIVGDSPVTVASNGLVDGHNYPGANADVYDDQVVTACCDIAIDNIASTDEGCPDAGDGSITITASCTSCSSIEYSIDNGASFHASNTFNGLADGTYNIVVRDDANNACSETGSATITAGTDTTDPVLANCPPATDALSVPQDECTVAVPDYTTGVTATDNCGFDAGGTTTVAAGGAFASGYYHALAIAANGSLWAWGRNSSGELGTGNNTSTTAPVQVSTPHTDWVKVDAGSGNHSIALREDGTLWTWGSSYSGQGASSTNVPTQLGTDTWIDFATLRSHVLAVRSDGTLWGWGRNNYGQLGIGNTTDQDTPVQVGTATNWKAVATGLNHSVGLREDGTLWGWGYNLNGEGGATPGSPLNVTTPTQIGTETDWAKVGAGNRTSFAIKENGTLWAWGHGSDGKLGTPTQPFSQFPPAQVGTETDWTAVNGGFTFTLGHRNNGTIYSWGTSSYGELGDGIFSSSSNTPMQIGTDTDWIAVDAGEYNGMGLKSDGTLLTWGRDFWGSLGDGPGYTDQASPVDISFSTTTPGNGAVITQSPEAGTLLGPGEHTITLSTMDAAGNTGTCAVTLTITDDQAPTFSCPQATTLNLNLCNEFELTAADLGLTGSDNCSGEVSFSFSQTNFSATGSYDIEVTATDENNNSATGTCTVNVTFEENPDFFTITTDDEDLGVNCTGDPVTFSAATLLDGDMASNGATLEVQEVNLVNPADGDIADDGNGNFTFTPANGATGSVALTYIVKVEGSDLYFDQNGHFYEFVVDDGITWTDARDAAELRTLNGQSGYLVTITSQEEQDFVSSRLEGYGWMGASDQETEGDWRWVTGPEAGQQFWNGLANGMPVGGMYNNWRSPGEPNNNFGHAGITDEDYGHFRADGTWNDYPNVVVPFTSSVGPEQIDGYVVEYGAAECVPSQTAEGSITLTLSDTDAPTGVCPASIPDVTIQANGMATLPANIGAGLSTDNCGTPTETSPELAFDCSQLGQQTVTLTADDGNGNTGTETCTFNVTDPNNNCCSVTISDIASTNEDCPDAGDGIITIAANCTNCTGTLEYSIDNGATFQASNEFTGLADGTYDIIVRDDANNACSESGSATIAAGTDTTEPVLANCPPATDALAVGQGECTVAVPDYTAGVTASDNCGLGTDNGGGSQNFSAATFDAGWVHSVAIADDGTLWAWGSDSNGELGNGATFSPSNSPVQISTDTDWKAVSVGGNHTLALKQDGTLWAWGANSNGQVGNSSNTQQNTPVQIGADTDWADIATGWDHSMALKADGTLWAWGANSNGQLGNGSTTPENAPLQIGSDSDWKTVSGGLYYSAATKNNGTIWAWGEGGSGNLGYSLTVNPQPSPQQIGADTDWAFVVAGYSQTFGLKTNGELWGWGQNTSGQLGIGSTGYEYSPVRVGNDTDWADIQPGYFHTTALKDNGSLWAWGRNSRGQLGTGPTPTESLSPIQVGNDTDWAAISSGTQRDHSLGIKADGTLLAWGTNSSGQLGIGSNVNQNTPTLVQNFTVSDGTVSPVTQSPEAGTLLGPGEHTITLSATDAANNTGTCTVTLTITDDQAPVAVCPAINDVTIQANGMATLPGNIGDGSSTDNCGTPTETSPELTFDCSQLGQQSVTLTADDGNGNTDTEDCSFMVTDPNGNCCTLPEIIEVTTSSENCPGDMVTITVNGTLNDATDWVLYSDECGGASIATSASGTFQVTDAAATYYVRGEGGCVSYGNNNIIWEEQFNGEIPATWALASSPAGADWGWSNDGTVDDVEVNGTIYTASFSTGQIQSPSAANGAALFNSDALDNNGGGQGNGPFPAPHNSSMTSPSLDCSGQSTVYLRFNQYFRNFQADTKIEVSNNGGGAWVDFPINTTIATNAATQLDDVVEIDISSVAANQADVRVRFTFDGNYYVWIIDDVQLLSSLSQGGALGCTSVTVTPAVDTENPTAVCLPTFIADLGNDETAAITAADLEEGSTDECGIQSITITNGPASFTCADFGQTFTVTVTVTDNNSLTDECTTEVTVGPGNAPDFDGDMVPDCADLDDDNDGILDEFECIGAPVITFEFDGTFGNIPENGGLNGTNYRELDNPPGGYGYGNTGSSSTRYVVTNNYGVPNLHGIEGLWPDDMRGHTTGTREDAFIAVNGSETQANFFAETVTLAPNTDYEFGAWAANARTDGGGAPEIGIRIKDVSNNEIAQVGSGNDMHIDNRWVEIKGQFNTGSGTEFTIEVYNISVTGGGNDFCLDDVFFRTTETPGCDTDNDTFANSQDWDSDGDGCNDVLEAGFNDPDEDGMVGTSPVSVNSSGLVTGHTYLGGNADVIDDQVSTACCEVTISSIVPTDENCPDAADGEITITANCTGCSGSLEYSIDNGANFQASSSFTGLADGTYDIVVQDDANAGCAATGSTSIAEGVDNTDPIANCLPTFIADLGNDETAAITAADLEEGSTDECGIQSITITNGPASFTCADFGQTFTVTVTVTDNNSLTDECTTEVTVGPGTAPDFDGDMVPDCADLDDDNDGVLDINECVGSPEITFEFNGTFGKISAAPSRRDLENTTGLNGYVYQANGQLNSGQYAVSSQTGNANNILHGNAALWPASLTGHTTGDADDAFLAVNASGIVGVFFRETVTLLPNTEYEFGVWAIDAAEAQSGAQVGVRIYDANNNQISSASSGLLNFEWREVGSTFNTGSETEYTIEVINESAGNSGNDFAIDDVFFRRDITLDCDPDNDGFANQFDTDSDGDGCFDAVEAGHTDPDGDGLLGNSPVVVDANGLVTGQGGYTGPTTALIDGSVSDACCEVTITEVASTNETCPDANDGSINITASCAGCTGTLEYSIDNGATFQASSSFTGLADGTYDIVVQDDANAGCAATGSTSIAAGVDNENPTASCAPAFTLDLDANQTATLTADMLDNNVTPSSDNCGTPSLGILDGNPTSFSCDDVGNVFTTTLVVSDASGNTSTCDVQVTIGTGTAQCSDFDGDGVPDAIDVDDDNDGILDVDECGFTELAQIGFENVPPVDDAQTAQDPRVNFLSDYNFAGTDVDLINRSPDFVADMIGSPYYAGAEGGSFAALQGYDYVSNSANNDGLLFNLTADELSAQGVTAGSVITISFLYAPGLNYDATARRADEDTRLLLWYGNGSKDDFSGNGDPSATIDVGAWTPASTLNGYEVMDPDSWKVHSTTLAYSGGDVHFIVMADGGPGETAGDYVYFDDLKLVLGDNCENTNNTGGNNAQDLDSDGDGCYDVVEAGHSDPDNDGILGTGTPTVDANGAVIGAGGYTGTTAAVTDASDATACCDIAIDNIAKTDEICPDAGDGTITITASCSSCTGALEYSIDDGANFQASGTFNGLADGAYNIVVRDNTGTTCLQTSSATIAAGLDIDPPSFACPGPQTLTLDVCGNFMLTPTDLGLSGSDNCGGIVSFGLSQTDFTAAGNFNVTVTATDERNNSTDGSCIVSLTLQTNPAQFTITAGDDDLSSECSLDSVIITSSSLLANDNITNNSPLEIQEVNLVNPADGTIVDNGNGTFTFTPENGVTGNVAMTYIVTLQGGDLVFPGNNHFYEFVPAVDISWEDARAAAEARTLNGQQGYLVTITSPEEQLFVQNKLQGQGWMGASDIETPNEWKWVTGPEAGTVFFNQTPEGSGGSVVGDAYVNWEPGEPNNFTNSDIDFVNGEAYAHFRPNGRWNDFPVSTANAPQPSDRIQGYMVEYGTAECVPDQSAVGNITLAIGDTQNPVAICPPLADITVDSFGVAVLPANIGTGLSTDNCGTPTESSPQLILNCTQLGTQTVTLTANDGNGNTATAECSFEVTDPDGNCGPGSDCSPVPLFVNDILIATGNYRSTTTLESAGTIPAAGNVLFTAGESITLKPGFTASAGSSFTARIEDCVPFTEDPVNAMQSNDSSEEEGYDFILDNGQPEETLTGEDRLKVFPNPFKNQATIALNLSEDKPVDIRLFNLNGQLVHYVLQQSVQPAGENQYLLHGNRMAPGVYILVVQTGEQMHKRRLVVIQ